MLTLLTMTGTRKQGAEYPADRYGLGGMATLGDTPGNGCPALGGLAAYEEASVSGANGWAKVVRLVSSSASDGGQATACSCGG